MEKDEMGMDYLTEGLMENGQYDKRTKWSMAKLVKDQMLEDEMAKDETVEDEVAWYPFSPNWSNCLLFWDIRRVKTLLVANEIVFF